MKEGSGSGSGSRRPKNIRICNTDEDGPVFFYDFLWYWPMLHEPLLAATSSEVILTPVKYSPNILHKDWFDTKAKCRHLHTEMQSVLLVFSTQLCELCPSNPLSGSTLPPPCVKVQYRYCVAGRGWGGGDVESCLGPYSSGVWHSVSDQI